jgi:peptide/nickel transport system ATP-binding protein
LSVPETLPQPSSDEASEPSTGESVGVSEATAGTPTGTAAPVVLDVRNLVTYFYTYDGVVRALEGVSFKLRHRETLGLVGETGCGKSVTMMSITRLIADPPGRVVSGHILFRGADLLWGLGDEAKFVPVKKTNRVKVKRSFRRIKAGLARVGAVRGGGIAMIFQEPSQAMNPIFSIADQLSETILEHRGVEVIDGLLAASTDGVDLKPAAEALALAVERGDDKASRAAAAELGRLVQVPSFGTQAFHVVRQGQIQGREDQVADVLRAAARFRLTGTQRGYLRNQRVRCQLEAEQRAAFMSEMRRGESEWGLRRQIASRRFRAKLNGLLYRLPIVRRGASRPLREENFWRSVRALEAVQIANPVSVARGYPYELSGGMLQRVMIAMALIGDPEILLADEPTTALDVTIQAQILELMRDLRQRVGTAILLVTHDLAVIAEVVDRVAVMYAGQIVEIAPVKDLFRRPLHPYTQGLLASIPRLDQPSKDLGSIPGSVPNLIHPPSGCRFHPRCPFAMPVCKEDRPPLTVEGEGHNVACFLYHGPTAVE